LFEKKTPERAYPATEFYRDRGRQTVSGAA